MTDPLNTIFNNFGFLDDMVVETRSVVQIYSTRALLHKYFVAIRSKDENVIF